VGRIRKDLEGLVARLEPDLLSATDAAALVEDFAAMERLCAAGKALAARRATDCGAWKRAGERSPAAWLARKSGSSLGTAIGELQTAERLPQLPATEQAVRAGKLSPAQAREIASAAGADPASEKRLLQVAGRDDLKGLQQACADVRAAATPDDGAARNEEIHRRRFARRSERNGVGRIEAEGTVADIAAIWAALQPFRERCYREAREAGRREPYEAYDFDALVAMAKAAGAGEGETTGPAARVELLVSLEALERGHLLSGERCQLEDGTPIDVATVRGLLGDAVIDALVTDGVDVYRIANVCRGARADQRKALAVRDPECVVPGCHAREHLDIDHIRGWAITRKTVLDDLCRLCRFHHRQKTYLGAQLSGGPGAWEWNSPPERAGPLRM
jgi:hypothetical protein